jgi:hypothetical protein
VPAPSLAVHNDSSATPTQMISLSTLVTISDPANVGYQKLELWVSNGTISGGQFIVNGRPQRKTIRVQTGRYTQDSLGMAESYPSKFT